jgi:hypothetical protein
MDKTMVFLVIFAVIAVVYVLYNTVKIEQLPLEKGLEYTAGNSMDEPFENAGAPLNYGIGKYSNIELKYNNPNNWRGNSQNVPLLKSPIYTGQGTPFPLKSSDSMQPVYPKSDLSVDGQPDSPTSMFMMAYNKSSPYCKSTYSTSNGQVCMSHQQSDWVALRGGNNSYNSDF